MKIWLLLDTSPTLSVWNNDWAITAAHMGWVGGPSPLYICGRVSLVVALPPTHTLTLVMTWSAILTYVKIIHVKIFMVCIWELENKYYVFTTNLV